MCDMNCDGCYYKEIKPATSKGHCYMFKKEPEGVCGQFNLSERAKKEMQQSLDRIAESKLPMTRIAR